MILRFDSRFDSTFFGFKIRFEDSAESSNLSNLKIRESYDSTNTGNKASFCLSFEWEFRIYVYNSHIDIHAFLPGD